MFNDLANPSTVKEQENVKIHFSDIPIKTERLPPPTNIHALKAIERLAQRRMKKTEMKEPQPQPEPLQASIQEDDDETFVSKKNATPIHGKEKVLLKFKIQQYKKLFPDKLKGFRINEKATEAEMKNIIDEMDILVNLGSFDNFLTTSILHALEAVEHVSAMTKFNISGTAQLLRANPQFDVLLKQLYLKYHIYTKIPIETQLIMLVGITASFAIIKNKQASSNFFDNPAR